jgi:DNA-binding MarR family transcriptional regulator
MTTTSGALSGEHGETAVRLRLAIARLFRQLKRSNPGDLTLSQWSALAAIGEAGAIRNSDLAAVENTSAPSMTRVVASLEEAGMVSRRPDPNDRRSSFVVVSALGAARLEWARGLAAESLLARLSKLPPDALAQVETALQVLEQLADIPDD